MFWTVLHNVKSPENAGILVRAHVAFGGAQIIVVGRKPWTLKRRAQAFSRRLERLCEFIHCPDDEAFFAWCAEAQAHPVAIEIATPPTFLTTFRFGPRPALVVGNEGSGLPPSFLRRCEAVLTIPQFGPVECLNTAVSGCLAMYELMRNEPVSREIRGDAYMVMPEETSPRIAPARPFEAASRL
jgi:23S rRNA (guanosine2251-2'-O)-methyltransferase